MRAVCCPRPGRQGRTLQQGRTSVARPGGRGQSGRARPRPASRVRLPCGPRVHRRRPNRPQPASRPSPGAARRLPPVTRPAPLLRPVERRGPAHARWCLPSVLARLETGGGSSVPPKGGAWCSAVRIVAVCGTAVITVCRSGLRFARYARDAGTHFPPASLIPLLFSSSPCHSNRDEGVKCVPASLQKPYSGHVAGQRQGRTRVAPGTHCVPRDALGAPRDALFTGASLGASLSEGKCVPVVTHPA